MIQTAFGLSDQVNTAQAVQQKMARGMLYRVELTEGPRFFFKIKMFNINGTSKFGYIEGCTLPTLCTTVAFILKWLSRMIPIRTGQWL